MKHRERYESTLVRMSGIDRTGFDEPLRFLDRQPPEHQRVHDRKYRRVRPNPERKRYDRGSAHHRRFRDRPEDLPHTAHRKPQRIVSGLEVTKVPERDLNSVK